MKNKIQSKPVPRGTRTIWRYLGALFLFFSLGITQMWADEVKLVSEGTTAISKIAGTGTAPSYLGTIANPAVYESGDKSYSVSISTNFSVSEGSEYKPDGSTKYKDYYYNANAACDMSTTPTNYIKVAATGCKISKIVVRVECFNSTPACFPAVGFIEGLPETTTIGSKTGRRVDTLITSQSGAYNSSKRFEYASTLTYTFSTNVSEVYFSKQIKAIAQPNESSVSSQPSSSQTSGVFGIDVYVVPTTAPTNYTVTLNPNGGSYASIPEGWTEGEDVYTKTVSGGTALAIPEPSRGNYDFDGWKSGTTSVALTDGKLTVSKDTTLTAQWVPEKQTPTVTFNDGAYVVGASALDLSGLFTSDNTNTPSFALKVASDDATVSGSNFTATKAGSYVVVATQAADANYKAVSEEATITVTYPATGEATILYNVAVGTENTALGTASKDDNSASISNLSNFTAAGGLTVSGRGAGKDGLSTKLQTLSSQDYAKYIYVTFDVADGKEFVLDSISTKIVAVTTAKTIKIVVSDTEGTKDSLDYSQAKNSTAAHHQFNFTSSAKAYAGTVTVKIYAYGATDDYRLAQPLKVCGTVQAGVVKYNVTFAAGTGASGLMSTLKYAEGVEVTLPACTFTPPTGKEFDEWVVTKTAGGASVTVTNNKFTMPAEAVTATATWKDEVVKYAITEGTPENGSVDADVAEAAAGETVTLTATPDEDYVFSAWDVYKTGESSTKVSVTNNTFTMPAYAVTVNATFVADPRSKVLYVTSNSESDTKSDDKLYAALKDIYNVKIVGPASDADQSGYALIVLHESIDGKSDYNKTAVATAKTGSIPVLNTKSYFYPSGRWNWGTPNAGTSVKGATMNSAYCNIADHPLFNDVTVSEGFIEITDDAADKCMQPVGSFTSGYEGYTLATTPNAESGNGCAIHEIPAGTTARGVSSGKYLMISVSNAKLDALNANGQKLFQNAAAYLIDGSASWTPIVVPTVAAITADPNAAYFVGDNIALTASATGTSAATTYTWYKGDNLAAAKEAGAIKAAATAAAGGNTYGVTGCALADAGTYWCVISNGTDCEAAASLAVTVSDVSYDIAFVSAHGTAPSATTGVSYTLPELSADGWAHQGWTANINVTVDAATVDAGDLIANGKLAVFEANVTFTAVWKQVFDVTFNLQDHGAAVAAQHILDGGKATEPNDPSEIGWIFGGWFTDAECTEGNEFDFNTAISDDTELFAKWTAFAGCVELWPATSGDAPTAANEVINLQEGSTGGSIVTVSAKDDKFNESFEYTTHGLALKKGGADVIGVTLNSEIAIGTKISVTLYSNNTGARGLNLLTSTGAKIGSGVTLGWADATVGAIETFTYTAEENDGLVGTNGFRLQRNNTVYLKTLKVESCGATIIYHGLTSAVDPTGKGTVTLGASSVREGHTTTATYSDIDPLYEFVSWSVSGAGASVENATANPATITVGTADAVVTLNLQLIPVKFTVNYYDGETPMGTEKVAVNEHPTASDIDTDKRHYTFQGWAETDGGSVVALNTITRTEATTVNLYAVYAPVVCPTSGTIFSMVPKPNELASDYQLSGTEEVTIESLGDYATVSGGELYLNNNNSSNRLRILKETSAISFVGGDNGYIHVLLDCQLKENDIIRFENSERLIIANNASKTGSVNIAKTVHQFVVPAAWEDKDEFYIWRDGTGMNISSLEVYRPALFTVTFDVLGHGSAPADLTDVLEGSKITAPTAPTDEDYAFVAWYKENTLDNEWDFNNDVVSANTTLFAKWLDKSDATLKSLKYGATDIELEDAVYVYEIALPSATASVPALTAVTNNPAANAVVTNAAAFDGEGKATSTVEVTPQKEGAAHLTYTVNFTKLAELPQVDVTTSTLWDFSLEGSTSLQNQTDVVLANVPGITNDATFNSQALLATFNKLEGTYFQGSKLMFNVAEEGLLTINFCGTNNKARHLQVCTGDGETVIADWDYNSGTRQTKSIEIPAGKVTLKAFEGEAAQNVRIYNLEYLTLAHSRTSGYKAGDLGTVCLEDAAVINGAKLYELGGLDGNGYLAFDEITNGKLEAGKPYLFEVTNPSLISFYKQVNAAHSDDEIETNGMIGTFSGTTLYQGAENLYYFAGRHIWRVNDFTVSIPIPAHRCYVDMDDVESAQAPAPGRRRVTLGINGNNAPTDVENVQSDEVQCTKVMINGQLFILRGEKMYDVTGKLVK